MVWLRQDEKISRYIYSFCLDEIVNRTNLPKTHVDTELSRVG